MRVTPFLVALMMISAITLTACGTRGGLYLPEQRYPQDAPAK